MNNRLNNRLNKSQPKYKPIQKRTKIIPISKASQIYSQSVLEFLVEVVFSVDGLALAEELEGVFEDALLLDDPVLSSKLYLQSKVPSPSRS